MTALHKKPQKQRRYILLTFLLAVAISGALYFLTPVTVATSISLQFEGIDQGKNPDDTRFDYTNLISEEVLKLVFQDAQIPYEDAYIYQFHVEPILPSNIVRTIKNKRIAGEDYTYFPNEFTVKVTPDRAIGLTQSMCESVMRQYADTYEAYFKNNYTFPFMDLNKLVDHFSFNTYDYPEYEKVFENEFAIISSYLNILERDDPDFVSSEGLTFSDLQEGLELSRRLDIQKMSSLVNSYKLSKDTEQLKIKYLYMIRRYSLEKSKAQNEYQLSQTLLDIVKQNKSTIMIPGVSGESLTYSAVNDTYDTIAAQVTNAQVSSVNIDEEVAYLNQKIVELDNPLYSPQRINAVKNEVDLLALELMEKTKSWVARITDTANEYFDYKYENVLTSVYRMRVNRTLSLTKAVVLSVVLWFVLTLLTRFTPRKKRY